MNKILILNLIIFTLFIPTLADEYHIEKLPPDNANGIEFILPPKSKLKFENETLKSKYRYHLITFSNLSSDYSKSLDEIENAVYKYDKDSEVIESQNQNGNKFGTLIECGEGNVFSSYELKNNILKIQLNYEVLFEKCKDYPHPETPSGIPIAFNDTAKELLIKISELEHDNGWATSISQNIVEKVFELIPAPNDSSLARFGYISTSTRTVLLLSPKFTLQVDLAVKTPIGNGGYFRYDFVGQVFTNIFRKISNGENQAFLEQRPFQGTAKGFYPENIYDKSEDYGTLVNLASSGDIQMSKKINDKKFIAFYEGSYKRNNFVEQNDKQKAMASISTCSQVKLDKDKKSEPDDEINDIICRQNSFLLFSDTLADFYDDNRDPYIPPYKPIKAVYGERGLITPLISILINKQLFQVPLKTTLMDLIQSSKVPRQNKLYRVWGKKKYEFEDPKSQLILLPGDSIEFRR